MHLDTSIIKKFQKKGFMLVKNLLNEDEIKKFNNIFDQKRNTKLLNSEFELSNKECWEFLIHNKLITQLKKLIGNEIYYMYDLNFVEHQIKNQKYGWHRDNPCRSTGVGPDWDNKKPYNVLTTITYMCNSKETKSVLNVLPGSHLNKFKYSASNIIRYSLNKLKNNYSKSKVSNIIKKFNGERIHYDTGDCIIFYSNLYHMGESLCEVNNHTRRLIVSRFGGSGEHSENYINYYLKHRKDQTNKFNNENEKEIFINFLKKNNLYMPIPKEKKNIIGAYSTI